MRWYYYVLTDILELQLTDDKIHPFQAYNPVTSVNAECWATVTTPSFRTFPSPQKAPLCPFCNGRVTFIIKCSASFLTQTLCKSLPLSAPRTHCIHNALHQWSVRSLLLVNARLSGEWLIYSCFPNSPRLLNFLWDCDCVCRSFWKLPKHEINVFLCSYHWDLVPSLITSTPILKRCLLQFLTSSSVLSLFFLTGFFLLSLVRIMNYVLASVFFRFHLLSWWPQLPWELPLPPHINDPPSLHPASL